MIQGMATFEAILPFLQTDVFNMQYSLSQKEAVKDKYDGRRKCTIHVL